MVDGDAGDAVPLRIEKPISRRFRISLQIRALAFGFRKLLVEESLIEVIRIVQRKYPTDAFILFGQIGFCDECIAGIDQFDNFALLKTECVRKIFRLQQGIPCLDFFCA